MQPPNIHHALSFCNHKSYLQLHLLSYCLYVHTISTTHSLPIPVATLIRLLCLTAYTCFCSLVRCYSFTWQYMAIYSETTPSTMRLRRYDLLSIHFRIGRLVAQQNPWAALVPQLQGAYDLPNKSSLPANGTTHGTEKGPL
jgi:hypothetical protein